MKKLAPNPLVEISFSLENLYSGNLRKIAFSTTTGINLVPMEQIIRCMADGCYSHIFLSSGKKLTISKTLKEVEELLPANIFIRTHKSHLVNINYILEYDNKNSKVILNDGSEIDVSLRKKDFIINFFKQLNKSYPVRR